MKRRRILLSLISVVLLLAMAVGVLSACNPNEQNPEGDKYTVTFKNGDTVVSTLTDIEEGTQLTAEQIPTLDNVPEDKEFAGWFVGEGENAVKVEAGYTVNGDVTAVAKLTDKQVEAETYTVTFKNGDTVVDTLTDIEEGTQLTAEQIPTLDNVPEDKEFAGWFVGEGDNAVKVEAGYTVNGNVIAVAKLTDKQEDVFAGFDADMVGTWVSQDESTTVVITANSITYNSQNGTALSVRESYGTKYYSFTIGTTVYSIYENDANSHLMVGVASESARIELSKDGWGGGDEPNPPAEPVEVEIPERYVGTWVGTGVTIVVTVDGLTVNGTAAVFYEEQSLGFIGGTLTFNIGDDVFCIDANYGGLTYYYPENDPAASVELEKQEEGIIAAEYIGSWIGYDDWNNTVELVITQDGISYKNDDYGEREAIDIDGNAEDGYTFTLLDPNGEDRYNLECIVYFDNGTLIFEDGRKEWPLGLNGVVVIPDDMVGSWYVRYYGNDGYVYIVVSVTEDSITVDGETCLLEDVEFSKSLGKSVWSFTINEIEYSIRDNYGYEFNVDGSYKGDFREAPETVTITFKETGNWGATEYKTVDIPFGGSITDDDYPESDPVRDAYAFTGKWLNTNTSYPYSELTLEDVFYENTSIIAEWERTAYIVTFQCTGMADVQKFVDIVEGKAILNEIPGTMTPDGQTKVGYFYVYRNTIIEATVGLELTDDITFTAYFVDDTAYSGAWYSDESGKEVNLFFSGDNNEKVTIGKWVTEETYTKNADGSIYITTGRNAYARTYTMTFLDNKMKLAVTYWDSIEEANVTDTYVLTKANEVDYAGTYVKANDGSSTLIITDGGVIIYFYGSTVQYGIIEKGSYYSYLYLVTIDGSSMISGDVTFDSKGNIVIKSSYSSTVPDQYKGIWVKNSQIEKNNSKWSNGSYTLYKHIVDSETLWVWGNDNGGYSGHGEYGYPTVEGEVAVGNIVTVTFNGNTYVIKITSSYAFEFAGEERGDFTGNDGQNDLTVTFDGFDMATIVGGEESDPMSYYMVGDDIAVIGDTGYKLNFENGTFTVLVAGEEAGTYYRQNSSTTYSVVLDGFGGLISSYIGNNPSEYYGTYTLNDDGTVTLESVQDLEGGVYLIKQNGNVLVLSTKDTYYYVKEGATIETQLNQFTGANNGWWKNDADEYVFIDIENLSNLTINGKKPNLVSSNWNGTVIKANKYPHNWVLTIVNGQLSIVDGEDEVIYTSAPEPVVEADDFIGTWTGDEHTFVFDGFGKVIYDGNMYDYSVSNGELTFATGTYSFTITGDPLNETLNVAWLDDSMTDMPSYTIQKQTEQDSNTIIGTWSSGNNTLRFDASKVYDVDRSEDATYSTNGADNKFRAYLYYENTYFVLNDDGTLTVTSDDGTYNGTYTKQA